MTVNLEKLESKLVRPFAAAALLSVCAAFAQGTLAAGTGNGNDQYTWSAELVSFDQASKTLTAKVRVDNPADVQSLHLMKGDPITLTWTGITWGAGIRGVARGHEASASADALTLPAQYVGTDSEDNYITFQVPVPSASISKIQALKPVDWITATSRRQAADPNAAVVAIRGYNDVS